MQIGVLVVRGISVVRGILVATHTFAHLIAVRLLVVRFRGDFGTSPRFGCFPMHIACGCCTFAANMFCPAAGFVKYTDLMVNTALLAGIHDDVREHFFNC